MSDGAAVLVVDDDRDLRETLCEILSDEGFEAFGASNGKEALERLRSGEVQPNVILLDLMMPQMNGWEFRAAQLRDPNLADIPVVVMSAAPLLSAQPIDAAAALAKPLQLEDLLALLRDLGAGLRPDDSR